MKYVVCSVRDRVTTTFSQPFYSPTIEAAIRSFRILINDSQAGMPNTHPDDFDLYTLGSFDDQTGAFAPESHPLQLALGKEMVKPLPLARS